MAEISRDSSLQATKALREIWPQENETWPMFGSGFYHWVQFSAIYRLLQPYLATVRAKLGSWEDRNLLGVAADIYYRPTALEKIDWTLFRALVRRMRDITEQSGAKFSCLCIPPSQKHGIRLSGTP